MKKNISILVVFIILFIALPSVTGIFLSKEKTYEKPGQANKATRDSDWYQKVQVYDMAALPEEDANKFHITVNGLWNGFFAEDSNLSSPFAFGRVLESLFSGETYNSDEEFVQSQHIKGFIVPATILTTQGHRTLQGEFLEEFACRSPEGEMIYWDKNAESYWMSANNPDFIDWCIQHGKKAIDAGADMIVLDEIQGGGFIPMFQFASEYLGIPAPGFSNYTIDGFRIYLSEKYTSFELQNQFDIADIETYDLSSRIAGTMDLMWNDRINQDPLVVEYNIFLEGSNFQAKKRLILALRDYASDKGKEIVITANSYALGTQRNFGFWPKGLQFSELLDFYTFENKYTFFQDEPLPDFPRNKWVAWEKLAYAATGAPAVIIIDTKAFTAVNPVAIPTPFFWGRYTNYLAIQCAEAYANKGAFVNYHFKLLGKDYNWEGCGRISGFALDNKELYETDSIIDTSIAFLFLYGEGLRTKINTYLGFAQALSESNTPYDMIFDGDGYYIKESLTQSSLENYEFLIIPSVIDITETQKQIIKDFVESGGTALIFNPEELDFEPVDGVIDYGAGKFIIKLDDIGSNYYNTYNDNIRQEIENLIETYNDEIISISNSDRKIVAYPYYQPSEKRYVIHLINYDHSKFLDKINIKENIEINIKKPDYPIKSIYLISPDINGLEYLEFEDLEDFIKITVPKLKIYDLLIIDLQDDKQIIQLNENQIQFPTLKAIINNIWMALKQI